MALVSRDLVTLLTGMASKCTRRIIANACKCTHENKKVEMLQEKKKWPKCPQDFLNMHKKFPSPSAVGTSLGTAYYGDHFFPVLSALGFCQQN